MPVPESPQPPAVDSLDCAEDRTDGGAAVVGEAGAEVSAVLEPCASSFPGWIKSPERGLTGPAGLNFSPVNSNLRDLTPSHTLEPLAAPFRPEAAAGVAVAAAAGSATSGSVPLISAQPPFSGEGQGQIFYPASEEASLLGFSRSLNADGGDGSGSAQNPPQKKKVRNSSSSDEYCMCVRVFVCDW